MSSVALQMKVTLFDVVTLPFAGLVNVELGGLSALYVILKNRTSIDKVWVKVPPLETSFLNLALVPEEPKKLSQVQLSSAVTLVHVTPGLAVVAGQVVVTLLKLAPPLASACMWQSVIVAVEDTHHS